MDIHTTFSQIYAVNSPDTIMHCINYQNERFKFVFNRADLGQVQELEGFYNYYKNTNSRIYGKNVVNVNVILYLLELKG